MGVPDLEQRLPSGRELGGFVRRETPVSGLRPTVRFLLAFTLTLFWVGFSIWVSEPWRSELEAAIGPVMGWVIPIFLAYIPGLVIWFMIFTLLITRYEPLPLEPPAGGVGGGRVALGVDPGGGVERERVDRPHPRTHRRALTYPGQVPCRSWRTITRPTTPGTLADAAGARMTFDYRRVFEAKQGKHHALNSALATVTTPLVVTVDADTPRASAVAYATGGSCHDDTAGPARLRLRCCARGREPDGDIPGPGCNSGTTGSGSTASNGSSSLEPRSRCAGCVLGLLDERPHGGRRLAGCDW